MFIIITFLNLFIYKWICNIFNWWHIIIVTASWTKQVRIQTKGTGNDNWITHHGSKVSSVWIYFRESYNSNIEVNNRARHYPAKTCTKNKRCRSYFTVYEFWIFYRSKTLSITWSSDSCIWMRSHAFTCMHKHIHTHTQQSKSRLF